MTFSPGSMAISSQLWVGMTIRQDDSYRIRSKDDFNNLLAGRAFHNHEGVQFSGVHMNEMGAPQSLRRTIKAMTKNPKE